MIPLATLRQHRNRDLLSGGVLYPHMAPAPRGWSQQLRNKKPGERRKPLSPPSFSPLPLLGPSSLPNAAFFIYNLSRWVSTWFLPCV
mmetsp:Transcript_35442/g.100357  ORF Transcript_35442/g.100357 Transcript_35442/m.100357 type:complete len:87 (+) Transcript_35442:421-681(+)